MVINSNACVFGHTCPQFMAGQLRALTCSCPLRPSCLPLCQWERRCQPDQPQTWQTASHWWCTWPFFTSFICLSLGEKTVILSYLGSSESALMILVHRATWQQIVFVIFIDCGLLLSSIFGRFIPPAMAAQTEGSACQLQGPTKQEEQVQCQIPWIASFCSALLSIFILLSAPWYQPAHSLA